MATPIRTDVRDGLEPMGNTMIDLFLVSLLYSTMSVLHVWYENELPLPYQHSFSKYT
jgi:hypothetical protein